MHIAFSVKGALYGKYEKYKAKANNIVAVNGSK